MGVNDMPMGSAFPRSFVPLLAAGLIALPPPLDRIAAAGGHPERVSFRASATIERDGNRYRISDERSGDQRLERECEEGDLCDGSWFDGDRLFTLGINGDRFPAGDAQTQTARTLEAVSSLRFAEPDFAGSVRADGAGYAVRARGGIDAVVALDAATALPTSVRTGDGAAIVFAAPQRFEGAAILAEVPFERIERLTAPPRLPPRPAVRFGSATPIAFVTGARLPIVPCRLERIALRCLFDTGTSPSALTLGVAERLGREPRGHLFVHSLTGYPSGAVDAGPVTIGDATIGALHYAVIPSTRDRGYDVVLGSDVLGSLRLELDLDGRSLTLAPSANAPAGIPLALAFEGGLPYLRVAIDGNAQDALLDTGDEALVAIGYDAYRKHATFAAGEAGRIAGALGDSDVLAGAAADVRVGDLALGTQRVVVVRSEHVGHVGLGLAARCRVLGIDLDAGRLDCVPR
jgi:hypothetical protein